MPFNQLLGINSAVLPDQEKRFDISPVNTTIPVHVGPEIAFLPCIKELGHVRAVNAAVLVEV